MVNVTTGIVFCVDWHDSYTWLSTVCLANTCKTGKDFMRLYAHLPITRMQNRDQYRMSIRGVSGLALEESKLHTFSRI